MFSGSVCKIKGVGENANLVLHSRLHKNQFHSKSEAFLPRALSNRVHRAKGWEDVPYDFLRLAFNIL